ncbi:amidase domain-containing protein [Glaciibacter superstes]|uniref:amidase domain-containing protein n=1 Tax=Glaciibacter superstes TaxID=501023 RepID=UPI0003B62A4F|nr:amidase domain-containing protein [Glaciibacter superstes]
MRPEITRDTRTQLPSTQPSRGTPNRSSNRSKARHRAEKPGLPRYLAIGGTTLLTCGIIAASLGFANGGAGAGAAAPSPTSTPLAALVAPPQPEPVVRGSIIATDGVTAGAPEGLVAGGTVVTVHGDHLGSVASANFGGNAGQVVAVTDDAVTISTPPATNLSEGTVPVELFDVAGVPVPVTAADAAVAAPAPADTAPTTPAPATPAPAETAAPAAGETTEIVPKDAKATEKSTDTKAADKKATDVKAAEKKAADMKAAVKKAADAAASVTASALPLSFSYVPDPHVSAQIDYAMKYWNDYNTGTYGVIAGNDCVNFTSQSLIERGWAMDSEWSFDPATKVTSSAWNSSTAFAAYMDAHPERGTALTDDQRAEVKVGDVVQFDWDNSGDRDHTAIVSKVVKSEEGGVEIYYAGHTNDTDYKSVDESVSNTGGSVSYWSIA